MADVISFIDGYDICYIIGCTLSDLISIENYLTIYTDRCSLYGLCISLVHTTTRRLQIDLAVLRQVYEQQDTTTTVSVTNPSNHADGMTKADRHSEALRKQVEQIQL